MGGMAAQGDIVRDSPYIQSRAWRAAAETALIDIQFTEAERKRRHDYYLAEAIRLEALCTRGSNESAA